MKYNKDNIIGVEFRTSLNSYIITRVDNDYIYGYKRSYPDQKDLNIHTLNTAIKRLNNGIWEVVSPPKSVEITFSIF